MRMTWMRPFGLAGEEKMAKCLRGEEANTEGTRHMGELGEPGRLSLLGEKE